MGRLVLGVPYFFFQGKRNNYILCEFFNSNINLGDHMKIFYEFPQFYLMFPNFKMATDVFLQKMTFFFWRLLNDKKISLLINLSNFSFNDKLTSKCSFFTSCLSQPLQTPKHYACESHFKLIKTCQLRFSLIKQRKWVFEPCFFHSFFFQ